MASRAQDSFCLFCKIAAGMIPASFVYEDSDLIAFLDIHPLFPGHILLCPREHFETFTDLPSRLVEPLFSRGQLMAKAVEAAVQAEGTFIAINNRVSQSVPHLHVHIVPRRRRDGLKGFFWPKNPYKDDEYRDAVRDAIKQEIKKLINQQP